MRQLTYYLDGGEHWTAVRVLPACVGPALRPPNDAAPCLVAARRRQTKERMMLELERDPAFQNDDRHDLTRPESRERTMRKVPAAAAVPHRRRGSLRR